MKCEHCRTARGTLRVINGLVLFLCGTCFVYCTKSSKKASA